MEYYTLLKHQEFVAALGTRNLPLRLVYGHLLGYTLRKGAWQGDVKELASQIELPIQTVRDQLKILTTKGLLAIDGNTYTAAVPQNTTTVLTDTRAVQNNTATVQPRTPINYINKMEINEKNARAQLRTAQPQNNPSFEKLFEAFTLRVGHIKLADNTRDECLCMWSNYPEWKRKMLLKQLQDGTWLKPRLDWLISDFNPQPTNYNGRELAKGVTYKTAKWQGSWGTYTLQDIQDFDLVTPEEK